MKKIITKTRDFIFARQTSIFSSTIIIGSMIMMARIFGFLRYRILAGLFTKEELDIYYAAFRIPDIIFEILITGALTTTFIPFFIKYQNNKKEQTKNISTIINIVMLSLIVGIIVLYIFLPQLIPIITPGFSEEKNSILVDFSRLLLIGQLPLFVASSFLTGISQARKTFIIPAIAPIVYNISIIIITILFHEKLHLLSAIIGVIVGAAGMFFIQLPSIFYSGFTYKFIIVKTKELWIFVKTATPRIITTLVNQIDATVDLSLASLIGAGSYTIFYLAQHLQLLPISIVGIAFGQASLPYLTDIYKTKNTEAFKKIITDSILSIFFITLPFMSFFIVARTPIVRLFFGGEKFDWEGTVLTARTLSFFALSIPFHSIYYFITRCFYAMFDSITPFIMSTVSIAINAILSYTFVVILKLEVWSLAISFSIAITINVSILIIILMKRIGGFDFKFIITELVKMTISTMIPTLILFYLQSLLDNLILDTSRTLNVFLLLIVNGSIFFILYLFLGWLFQTREMYLITKMIIKLKEYQRKILEVYTGTSIQ
jgi:putative peptidoglycan lipid II flippase